jgi:AraC-like DNA-binding protein
MPIEVKRLVRQRYDLPSIFARQKEAGLIEGAGVSLGIKTMSGRLKQIQDWPERARQAKYSAAALAKQCGVSRDTLRRHFLEHFGQNPQDWLAERRQQQAMKLLYVGSTVKETAASLGYQQQTNFTRQFKGCWGVCPTQMPPPTAASMRFASK